MHQKTHWSSNSHNFAPQSQRATIRNAPVQISPSIDDRFWAFLISTNIISPHWWREIKYPYSVHDAFSWFVFFCVVILFIYFNGQLKSAFFSGNKALWCVRYVLWCAQAPSARQVVSQTDPFGNVVTTVEEVRMFLSLWVNWGEWFVRPNLTGRSFRGFIPRNIWISIFSAFCHTQKIVTFFSIIF